MHRCQVPKPAEVASLWSICQCRIAWPPKLVVWSRCRCISRIRSAGPPSTWSVGGSCNSPLISAGVECQCAAAANLFELGSSRDGGVAPLISPCPLVSPSGACAAQPGWSSSVLPWVRLHGEPLSAGQLSIHSWARATKWPHRQSLLRPSRHGFLAVYGPELRSLDVQAVRACRSEAFCCAASC